MRQSTFLLLFLLSSLPAYSQIVNIEELRITGTKDTIRWYGHLKANANLMKVKEQSLQVGGDIKVQYKKDPYLFLLLLNSNLLRAGNQNFTNQHFIHGRFNYELSEKWTAEAFTQWQSNPVQLLNNRVLVGAGLRYRALKSSDGRQRLYLGCAWMGEQNNFAGREKAQQWNRLSSYASIMLRAGSNSSLIGTTYWQPVIGLAPNYRLSTDWLLRIGITQKLSFVCDFNWSKDTNLPEEASAITYSIRNGLMLQL